jgi:hypothetical protein
VSLGIALSIQAGFPTPPVLEIVITFRLGAYVYFVIDSQFNNRLNAYRIYYLLYLLHILAVEKLLKKYIYERGLQGMVPFEISNTGDTE